MGRMGINLEESPVEIPIGRVKLNGDLSMPAGAKGIVLFAHGSGSSRLSPRNRFVASVLQRASLATLLFDLLSSEEEAEDSQTARFRFNVRLLASRLISATDWIKQRPDAGNLPVGYFGASTGAAAALVAAVERPQVVKVIVLRGGRPDLAGPVLNQMKAPTLLIVGGRDYVVIAINQKSLEQLPGEKRLAIVPGATHLFEEPGTLEEVARLAANWFTDHL